MKPYILFSRLLPFIKYPLFANQARRNNVICASVLFSTIGLPSISNFFLQLYFISTLPQALSDKSSNSTKKIVHVSVENIDFCQKVSGTFTVSEVSSSLLKLRGTNICYICRVRSRRSIGAGARIAVLPSRHVQADSSSAFTGNHSSPGPAIRARL